MKWFLDVVRLEMTMDFDSKELEPMLDEGGAQTDLGLLKIVRIACWIKMVYVKLLACGCLT